MVDARKVAVASRDLSYQQIVQVLLQQHELQMAALQQTINHQFSRIFGQLSHVLSLHKILNGSVVGKLIDVIYGGSSGPTDLGTLPLYCVVDFPESNIPEDHKCIPGMPRTTVAISVITEYCC